MHRIERDLSAANAKVLLISPYFVPGPDVTAGMTGLAEKGVTVGVVTNSLGANDVAAVYGAYRPYRDALIGGGVHVYELRAQGHPDSSLFGSSGASLHTKAYSVDDARGFIGSFNLDARSAYLNTEMGVMFDDADLAKAVRDEYLRLSGPELSYWMHLVEMATRTGWIAPRNRRVWYRTGHRWQRASATAISWLPLESQL